MAKRTGGRARLAGFAVGAIGMAAAGAAYLLSPPSPLLDLVAIGVCVLLSAAVVATACRLAVKLDRAHADLANAWEAVRATEEEASALAARFQIAIDNMSQGLCMFGPDHRLLISNSRYADIYSIPREQVKPGMLLEEILETRIAAGNIPSMGVQECVTLLVEIAEHGLPAETMVEQENGRVFLVGHTPLSGGGWVATHQDITDRRAAEAKIAYMVRHDHLTHLPNRMAFRDHLEQSLDRLDDGRSLAVLCLDLDRFKRINDTLGHHVGDLMLIEVAERLRACVRETDMVARLSGDEFAIVLTGNGGPAEATALARRIAEAIGLPFTLDGHQVVGGTSIGIAIAPNDGAYADRLLKAADMALYRAKADGRATYRFFEPEMDARLQERRTLESDLRKAIERDEFVLHYQSAVNLVTGRIDGFEALLRQVHPDGIMLPPDEFIPIAEETGLIIPLGEWVIRKACEEAARWPQPVRVAVNLSPVQLRNGNLVPTVKSALADTGLRPDRLELEITESVLLRDSDGTLAKLHQLRGLGVRIAMDNFGVGYSSLSCLRLFPFDKIKIDRSFIHDLPNRGDSTAIVRAVAALGGALGIPTTAEGVETAEQLECARAEGCTEVQGYLFSPPRAAADIAELLASQGASVRAVA